MKIVLNVAEKPSVAKEIAKFLSNDSADKQFSASKYNPIYEFQYQLGNEQMLMRVASVSGHIMGLEFVEPFNKWNLVSPEELFTAPIEKKVTDDKTDVVNSLKFASKGVDILALWLDCDREGENIAYEVVQIVMQVKTLHPTMIKRAHFSALTRADIVNAIQNLQYPKQELSDAVDARQEIDLRLGAAFTRLQTLKLRNEAPALNGSLISWGPCQFPTLGFVVSRYLEIQNFIPEPFWTLDLTILKPVNKLAKFVWKRERLFDFFVTLVLYENCVLAQECSVTSVTRNPKTKLRPVPLSTVEFIKLASSKLRIGSERAMAIAEKLYQEGMISYPRTETDAFKNTINLRKLVEIHKNHSDWGGYVEGMSDDFQWPRNGGHDDNSHPPIHPVKCVNRSQLSNDEWKVYELVTRRFLAACSQDAKGFETKVLVVIGGETFECKGLEIVESNFLQVYVYLKWAETEVPSFVEGERIIPTSLLMTEHTTQPPNLLSESDLISVMDKSGIGTDATIHQHIKTIQDRKYAEKTPAGLFKPTMLGLALVQGYAGIGVKLHQPELRAKMEKEMNEIVNKSKNRRQVVENILIEMKDVYLSVKTQFHLVAKKVKETILNGENLGNRNEFVCFKCGESGHLANTCDKEVLREGERVISCYKCGKNGHYSSSCQEIVENGAGKAKTTCFKCGKEGHFSNNCPENADRDKSDRGNGANSCFKCGKQGHFANNCPEVGSKPGKKDHYHKNYPEGGNKPVKKEPKQCPKCGRVGRHPNGSECTKKNRK